MIGRVLNHSQPSATAVSAPLDLEPVRRALEANALAMLAAERSAALKSSRICREGLTEGVDYPIGASPRGTAVSNRRERADSPAYRLVAYSPTVKIFNRFLFAEVLIPRPVRLGLISSRAKPRYRETGLHD